MSIFNNLVIENYFQNIILNMIINSSPLFNIILILNTVVTTVVLL